MNVLSELATIVAPQALAPHVDGAGLRFVDCRFHLGAPEAGQALYLDSHIAGAVYADLEHDLSGPPLTDHGRHPLPSPEVMNRLFGRLGIGRDSAVVVYDDSFGMVAARLWWMLRYMGHRRVAVLEGGWQAWVAAGLPVCCGAETAPPRTYQGTPRRDRLVTLDELSDADALIDARDPQRYAGVQEPIDARAGHIPGAGNAFWRDNIDAEGRWLDAAALNERLVAALHTVPDQNTVHYCGSGVSACHNVLAQILAGLPEPRLYCGSWSEWCRDRRRRVMMGSDPG